MSNSDWARVLAVCLFIGSPQTGLATENNPGSWTSFTTTDAFQTDDGPSRWRYWFDAQARYFDLGSGRNQYVARPGIGYALGDNVTAWVGYARLRARNQSGNVTDENRYWQQLAWTAGRWHNSTFSMRARLEQRSLSSGNDVGLVLRYQTKYVQPLGKNGKTELILSLEPFFKLNDTDWSGKSGFGQIRTTVSVGWRVSDSLVIETGYMNQFVSVDGGEDRSNHLAVLNFKVKL